MIVKQSNSLYRHLWPCLLAAVLNMNLVTIQAQDAASPAAALINLKRPLIIGHRGYPRFAPENTLPSFKLALEAGADLIELDYHQNRDGDLVVIHDFTL